MKAIRSNGIKLEMVDIDYDFLKEQMGTFVNKNQLAKATALKKLLDVLDQEEKKGKEITVDVIEDCVNKY